MKNGHNDEKTLQHKFFKEILTHMQMRRSASDRYGTSQEQLIRLMKETSQFKNTITNESTSNKMNNENLATFIAAKFNNLN